MSTRSIPVSIPCHAFRHINYEPNALCETKLPLAALVGRWRRGLRIQSKWAQLSRKKRRYPYETVHDSLSVSLRLSASISIAASLSYFFRGAEFIANLICVMMPLLTPSLSQIPSLGIRAGSSAIRACRMPRRSSQVTILLLCCPTLLNLKFITISPVFTLHLLIHSTFALAFSIFSFLSLFSTARR